MLRRLGLMSLLLALACPFAVADEPRPGEKLQDKIVGTWRLKSAKYGGRDFVAGEGATMLKHVTPSQFMWATYDKEGNVTRAAGGSYTLKGDTYEELPDYGIGADFDLIKARPQTFSCRIDGDTWYHNGKLSNGLTIDEVWERDPSK